MMVLSKYPKCGEGLSYMGVLFFRQLCYCESRDNRSPVMGCDLVKNGNRTALQMHFLSSKSVHANFTIFNLDNITGDGNSAEILIDLTVGSTEFPRLSPVITQLKKQ
ncbi:uncharacterized protein LOC142358414, partial [Convolutriloba macropyga]|uniref:uncharacterized protein LOC142358414 n=1 Tax=Convolutriloba macropyga TaxID=536237 RepID=UPI003F51E76D